MSSSISNAKCIQPKSQQEPPRYQPPPQVVPNKSNATAGPASASCLQLTPKQLHQMHQQQAAKLASQVKDAVQAKFQPHQLDRADKSQANFGLQQQQAKNYLQPSGVPTATSSIATTSTVAGAHVGLPSNGNSSNNSNAQQAQLNGIQSSNRQRISDDELLRLGPLEMLKFVRKTEGDIARMVAEQHRQIQALMNELRALKEANQRLSDDNQELRDLCCFLDDDRQKGRKLAREWQRFGRYTASVMRQEVSAYQNKLRQLDNKQQELIKDNLELKELCLYLDEERGGAQRDDGDGSSSSTNADESAPAPARVSRHAASAFNDQMMQYVRSLEQRIKQLEEDKSALQARAQQNWPSGGEAWDNQRNVDDCHLGSRPEAVVRALQVLEVREQLEREAGHDGEKALVREMCNKISYRRIKKDRRNIIRGNVENEHEYSTYPYDPHKNGKNFGKPHGWKFSAMSYGESWKKARRKIGIDHHDLAYLASCTYI